MKNFRKLPLVFPAALAALMALSLARSGRLLPAEPQIEANEGYRQLWLGNSSESVRHFEKALNADPVFPYRWSDLGDALVVSGDTDRARQCFRRALELAPRDPQIALRAANFHFRVGEPDAALRIESAVLQLVPDYDQTVFSTCIRMGGSVEHVLDLAIGDNARAAREFFGFLIRQGNAGAEDTAWKWMELRRFVTRPTALSRTTSLLDQGRSEEAAAVWKKYVSPSKISSNAIENSGFEHPWENSGFDWRVTPIPGIIVSEDGGVAHEGRQSLRIRFDAVDNPDFHYVSQLVLLNPGRYRLTAWIRTEDLSTDQGICLRIASALTENLSGTHDWTKVSAEFNVPAKPTLEKLEVVRRPSLKFASKLKGTVWLDDVQLVPTRLSPAL